MLTTVRQIGNSKGVLIPAAFLASCNIEDAVNMKIENGQIIISPVTTKRRVGWFDNAANTPALSVTEQLAQDQALLDWAAPNLADDSEWQW